MKRWAAFLTPGPGHCKLKQYKPWFREERSKLLDQRTQAKL
jgi:hypothetical protein